MFFVNLLETNLQTKLIGKKINYFTTTKSTNDDIWELYNTGAASGEVVITDNQTNGRGQRNNKWHSNPGQNILCSFLLYEKLNIQFIGIYPILIGVGISRGVEKLLSIKMQLKWPNDIYYENKKIGGVLIESKIKKNSLILNIGMGINVNQNIDSFPNNISDNVNSLKNIVGHPIQRELLLSYIFNEIDILFHQMNPRQLIEEWNNRCININKTVSFNLENKLKTGIFKKINNKGQSIIKYNNNEIIYDGAIIQV